MRHEFDQLSRCRSKTCRCTPSTAICFRDKRPSRFRIQPPRWFSLIKYVCFRNMNVSSCLWWINGDRNRCFQNSAVPCLVVSVHLSLLFSQQLRIRDLLAVGINTLICMLTDGKQVSCIRTLTSGTAIITRQHSARDTIRFWDIRNLTKPVFCFVSTDVSSSVSDGQFHIDETETFLSCSNADHVFRIWNISTGQTMLELDHKKSLLDSPLLSGIYSNNWKLFGFKPGIVGLCKNRLAWFPLP